MFKRQTTGSVVCVSCGYLVGVNDEVCYHCGRRNPGLWGFAPALRSLGNDVGFVTFVTGTCIVMYALSLLMSGPNIVIQSGFMNILMPSRESLFLFGASGAVPVFGYGRWWTILSASWLHGSLLHIAFNLYWVRQLAPEVGELYGPGRMVIVYTLAGAAGFTLSSFAGLYLAFLPIPFLQGGMTTVGASASILGLLGALVYYGRRTGSSVVHSQAKYLALMLILMGFVIPGTDNYAHAGGFLGGFVAGRLLDPLKPERVNHIVLAILCLTLSMLAIVASVLFSLRLR
jgi:rhomboid protease GluP